jgi:hypothetical protein
VSKIPFLLLFGFFANSQCNPAIANLTITGLYTSDLNPTAGSVIYITSNATVTGNIYLNNASVYNCGTILSPLIKMKQSLSNNQYVFENNNMIRSDSVLLDSLGHIHNLDTMICNVLQLRNNSSYDQNYILESKRIVIEGTSKFNTESSTKVDYFEMKDNGSWYYSHYGNISARKLFKVGANTSVFGMVFICADSAFVNNGQINSSSLQTWSPSIKINGISENNGSISNIDFCDLTTMNGGLPDINTGTLTNVTNCASQQQFCDYTYTSFIDPSKEILNFNIFPNPTKGIFKIKTTSIVDNISIYNSDGAKIIFSEVVNNEIDISSLNNGIYVCIIQLGGARKSFKILKE